MGGVFEWIDYGAEKERLLDKGGCGCEWRRFGGLYGVFGFERVCGIRDE